MWHYLKLVEVTAELLSQRFFARRLSDLTMTFKEMRQGQRMYDFVDVLMAEAFGKLEDG